MLKIYRPRDLELILILMVTEKRMEQRRKENLIRIDFVRVFLVFAFFEKILKIYGLADLHGPSISFAQRSSSPFSSIGQSTYDQALVIGE